MAAILVVLSAAARLGSTAMVRLLDGAVPWLLARETTDPTTAFPFWVGAGSSSGCTAWCRGDPAVAVGLVAAGRARDRADWIAAGIRIANTALARSPSVARVSHAGLCHGA